MAIMVSLTKKEQKKKRKRPVKERKAYRLNSFIDRNVKGPKKT
jgi:hypothetical protein